MLLFEMDISVIIHNNKKSGDKDVTPACPQHIYKPIRTVDGLFGKKIQKDGLRCCTSRGCA